MKKFNIPCNFNGKKVPVTFYIGKPQAEHNPIHFQAEWLASARGGNVPQEVLQSLDELMVLSKKNGVPFEELCEYALKSIEASQSVEKAKEQNEPEKQ